MTTKKTTTKKATKEKVKWDEVESVKPDNTPKPTVSQNVNDDGDVPFGGASEVEQVIAAYRQYVTDNPIPKKGVAQAPNGNQYSYYLTEDVFNHAYEFCSEKGCLLQQFMDAVDGVNVMSIQLEHLNSGYKKSVSATLGSPSSMADFGGRITYAPKYLIAVLFGISVQTDTDAFMNGQVKNDNKTNNDNTTTRTGDAGVGSGGAGTGETSGGVATEGRDKNVGDSSSGNTIPNSDTTGSGSAKSSNVTRNDGAVEHTPSYFAAKNFIEKSNSEVMLSEAETKLSNSVKLTDAEKEELTNLLASKREENKTK